MKIRKIPSTIAALALLAAAAPATSAVVTLAPYLPSSTTTASGASATFIRIDNSWHDSSVPYDEATGYGSGAPIGSYGWGSGLWGIADFNTILNGGVTPVDSWRGSVSSINFGDGCYNTQWSESWGGANLAPIFSAGTGCASTDVDSDAANDQDNWISYFSGYIRITEDDLYNFSVLYDDGFFLTIYGANGELYTIDKDYLNSRDRLGYDFEFALSQGLYRFELGAYDRLQAGVVDLAWRRGDDAWSLVPTEHLARIPEPATLGLLVVGLAAVMLASRRRMRTRERIRDPHGP